MAETFNLGNALQAGDRLLANEQNRDFNSLRLSGERQRQDLQQRTFNAEEQQANTRKMLVGIDLLEKDLSLAPRVLDEFSRSGLINEQVIPQMLAEAQSSPETFLQKMSGFRSRLQFALGEGPAQPKFGAARAGTDVEGNRVGVQTDEFGNERLSEFGPPAVGSFGNARLDFFNTLSDAALEVGPDGKPTRRAIQAQTELGTRARAGTVSGLERRSTDPGLGESVVEQQAREAARTTGAKAEETRLQGIITQGQVVADGLPVLRRSLELLDVVATGGVIREAQLAFAKSLGVETADQGEISANLGKAVLSQLRETFGAQFTEAEGQRLVAIEAGFGKNNQTNRRLLGQAIKIIEAKANRAIALARSRGDEATAQIIEDAMQLSLTPGAQQGSEGIVIDFADLPQ